jgi:hypothetical protein
VHKAYLQVHRLKTSPTKKLRLEFKEKQYPSLTEKVIVLDDTPPQPTNKKKKRESTHKISHVSSKAHTLAKETKSFM